MTSVYHVTHAPDELKSEYPSAAIRNFNGKDVYFFADTLLSLIGTVTSSMIDISIEDLEGEAIDIRLSSLIAETSTGREIKASLKQLDYVFNKRFKPEEELE